MLSKIFLSIAIFLVSASASPTGDFDAEDSVPEERNFKGLTECRNSGDCPRGYCCTVGMQRYSIPSCFPLGIKDDPCRPGQAPPANFTLTYPNMRTVEVQGAYTLLCPCHVKFSCDRESNTCQDPSTIKYKSLEKDQLPNDI